MVARNEIEYYEFAEQFALLQKEKEVWRCLARKQKVLINHKIPKDTYLWRISPSILDEIIKACKK